jgi:hypothetical protein
VQGDSPRGYIRTGIPGNDWVGRFFPSFRKRNPIQHFLEHPKRKEQAYIFEIIMELFLHSCQFMAVFLQYISKETDEGKDGCNKIFAMGRPRRGFQSCKETNTCFRGQPGFRSSVSVVLWKWNKVGDIQP